MLTVVLSVQERPAHHEPTSRQPRLIQIWSGLAGWCPCDLLSDLRTAPWSPVSGCCSRRWAVIFESEGCWIDAKLPPFLSAFGKNTEAHTGLRWLPHLQAECVIVCVYVLLWCVLTSRLVRHSSAWVSFLIYSFGSGVFWSPAFECSCPQTGHTGVLWDGNFCSLLLLLNMQTLLFDVLHCLIHLSDIDMIYSSEKMDKHNRSSLKEHMFYQWSYIMWHRKKIKQTQLELLLVS